MASNAPSQDGDSFEVFMILTLLIIGAFMLLYTYQFHWIAFIWKALRIAEFWLVKWMPDWVPFWGSLELDRAYHWLISTPSRTMSAAFISKFDHHFAKWFMWIPGAIIILIGMRFNLKREKLSSKYNIESLLSRQADFFPQAAPYVTSHPELAELRFRRAGTENTRYSMALSPADFCRMVPPPGLEKDAKKDASLAKPIWDGYDEIDTLLAQKAFEKQLGKRYSGLASLSPLERKLYDALVPRLACPDAYALKFAFAAAADLIPEEVRQTYLDHTITADAGIRKKIQEFVDAKRKKNPDFRLDEQSLRSLALSKGLESALRARWGEVLMRRHAYSRTGLMTMLQEARNTGNLASNELEWLKPEDRTLWYCMATVGRKTAFIECAGVYAHWLLECLCDFPVPEPDVTEAVESLYIALKIKRSV